jgi:hypothetical protein
MVKNRLLIAGGLLIGACYLAHLAGPLRVVDDGLLYLAGAVDLATGVGYRELRLPRGYPQALATLDLVGLNSSVGIVGLNLISIAMGLVFIFSVIRSEMGLSDRVCATVVLLTCCSWLWIYLAPVPMSEMVYFCLSSACLAALSQARLRPGRAPVFVIGAFVLAVAAVLVRTIGLALIAAVAFCFLAHVVRRFGRVRIFAACGVGLAAVAVTGFFIWPSILTPEYLQSWRGASALYGLTDIGTLRVAEVGEIFQNFSARALVPQASVLPIETVSFRELATRELQSFSYLSGIVAIGFIFAGAIHRRVFSFLEVYLACYVGILLVWPFTDPRFFAPLMPLLLAYAWIGLQSLSGRMAVKRVIVCYCVVFCLFGAVAMGHSLDESTFGRTHTNRVDQQWRKQHVDWFAAYRHFGGVCEPRQSTQAPLSKSAGRSG